MQVFKTSVTRGIYLKPDQFDNDLNASSPKNTPPTKDCDFRLVYATSPRHLLPKRSLNAQTKPLT